MFARSLRRCAAAGNVPNVFVQFGLEQQFRFVSHPGVMCISKLVEMRTITRMRANFTQANIEEMKKFDPELARKAQIAYDNKLPVNFQQLEVIEENLPRLLEEKKQLEALRGAVGKIAVGGPYEMPKGIDISAARPVPNQKDLQGSAVELTERKGFKIPEHYSSGKQIPK
eukprot:TRINITY_DN4867_c0_g1_i1.p2 TRINITY_DN4867_c0_g1~~TRINITY_DN4867_c0_g1_i1.p2  ORF type:complete len:170 (+),score=58.36 TRINITY_DN4867_c0_g1_i1:187-696(+)